MVFIFLALFTTLGFADQGVKSLCFNHVTPILKEYLYGTIDKPKANKTEERQDDQDFYRFSKPDGPTIDVYKKIPSGYSKIIISRKDFLQREDYMSIRFDPACAVDIFQVVRDGKIEVKLPSSFCKEYLALIDSPERISKDLDEKISRLLKNYKETIILPDKQNIGLNFCRKYFTREIPKTKKEVSNGQVQ